MNERIEKLVIEAGFPKFDKMYVVTDGEELEKFAELIVRECALVANLHNEEAEGVNLGVGKVIKEHFGVEE